MTVDAEEAALDRFRERAEQAQPGWLPPAEERAEFNEDVLVKSLGIAPEDFRPGVMDTDQRLTLISLWFAGAESKIPYEEWGLDRPAWIPRPAGVGDRRWGGPSTPPKDESAE